MNKGLVYIIKNKKDDKVYIGSTVDSLRGRFSRHMKEKNCSSKCLLDKEPYIELLEEVEFEDIKELRNKETEYILKYADKCVNMKKRVVRTEEEKTEYMKQYANNNKEKLNEYHQNYYEINKEKMQQQMKQYREQNKEIKKQKDKERYLRKREEILQKARERYQQNKNII